MLINLAVINGTAASTKYPPQGDLNGPSQVWRKLWPIPPAGTWTKATAPSASTWNKSQL